MQCWGIKFQICFVFFFVSLFFFFFWWGRCRYGWMKILMVARIHTKNEDISCEAIQMHSWTKKRKKHRIWADRFAFMVRRKSLLYVIYSYVFGGPITAKICIRIEYDREKYLLLWLKFRWQWDVVLCSECNHGIASNQYATSFYNYEQYAIIRVKNMLILMKEIN